VLVSSHLMSELQDAADHVVVVGRGRVIADAGVAEMLAAAADGRVTVRTTSAEASGVLAGAGGTVTPTGPDTLVVSGLPAETVVALLSDRGVPFSEVSAHRATLEEAYLRLTRDAVEFRAATR
jgi:ABC-2 type transport system ATP-binding protein